MSDTQKLDDLEPNDGDAVKGGSIEPDELSRARRDPEQFAQDYPREVVGDVKPAGP